MCCKMERCGAITADIQELSCNLIGCFFLWNGIIDFHNNIIIIIFIYTAQIQRTFSNAPYNSKSFTILKSNLQFFHQIKSNQIKSNVGF